MTFGWLALENLQGRNAYVIDAEPRAVTSRGAKKRRSCQSFDFESGLMWRKDNG